MESGPLPVDVSCSEAYAKVWLVDRQESEFGLVDTNVSPRSMSGPQLLLHRSPAAAVLR